MKGNSNNRRLWQLFGVVSLVALIVALPMAGCAKPATAPTPTPSQEVITWKGQCQFAAGAIDYESFVRACDMVEEMSGGRLVLEPHPSDAVVPALEAFAGVDTGALDFAMDPCNYWRDKWVVAGLFDNEIAGMSPVEQFLWYLHGGGVELARRMVEGYNVHITRSGSLWPPEIFLSTTRALDSLEDIKGLKIRTAGDDGEVFTAMGASVTMIPGGEIYEAMQRGTIDAFQFLSPATDYTMGFHEVIDYLYLSPVRQPCSTSTIIVNKDRWAELTPELQSIVESAFLTEAWHWYAIVTQEDAKAIEKYKEYGVTVGAPPEDIEAAMASLADKMYTERAEADPFYKEVLDSRHNFQKAIRETYERL